MVNLDPAVQEVPYPANIDICDSVKYKEVMKQYNLGPNGGIVTSLNLFATRFDQVMSFLDKRKTEYKYVLKTFVGFCGYTIVAQYYWHKRQRDRFPLRQPQTLF